MRAAGDFLQIVLHAFDQAIERQRGFANFITLHHRRAACEIALRFDPFHGFLHAFERAANIADQ